MNAMIIKITINVVSGLAIAAGSFFAGWKIQKNKSEKEIKKILKDCTDDVNRIDRQMKELHRIFVESQEPEIAEERERTWKEIAAQTKELKKAVKDEKTNPEASDLTIARKENEYTDYRAISSGYLGDAEQLIKPDTPKVGNSEIYEISEDEYNVNQEFPLEMLDFYEGSYSLFKEDTQIPEDEFTTYLGVSPDIIGRRFMMDGEPSYIFIRNGNNQVIYQVFVCQGDGPI
jgi:hypothetical protein